MKLVQIRSHFIQTTPIFDPIHKQKSRKYRNRRLFEGDETGRVGGTDTGTTVLDRLAVVSLALRGI